MQWAVDSSLAISTASGSERICYEIEGRYRFA
jgi:hypothetical protein